MQGGARLVCGPRSAFRTSSGATWQDGQFGPLSSLVGARLLHYDSLRPGLEQQISGGYAAQLWAESYRLHGAQATHTYQGGSLDGQPAAIRQGDVSVLGTHSGALIHDVLRGVLEEIGLPAADLPESVRLSRRAGKVLLQNWNDRRVTWQGHTLQPVGFEIFDEDRLNLAPVTAGKTSG